jgi:hypothetical protein
LPASDARIAANHRNALRSTGPRTPEGKARVARNALKHGLRSRSVFPFGTPAAAPALDNAAGPGVSTQPSPESALLAEIAHASRMVRLAWKLEAEALSLADPLEAMSGLDLAGRYEAAWSRKQSKAVARLAALRDVPGLPNKANALVPASDPAATPAPDPRAPAITEQTQSPDPGAAPPPA